MAHKADLSKEIKIPPDPSVPHFPKNSTIKSGAKSMFLSFSDLSLTCVSYVQKRNAGLRDRQIALTAKSLQIIFVVP